MSHEAHGWRADKPYNAFPKLPPAADIETRAVLKQCVASRAALAELRHRPLASRTAEVVCTQLKGTEMTVRKVPGTQLVNSATGAVAYTPPEGVPASATSHLAHTRQQRDRAVRTNSVMTPRGAWHPPLHERWRGRCTRDGD